MIAINCLIIKLPCGKIRKLTFGDARDPVNAIKKAGIVKELVFNEIAFADLLEKSHVLLPLALLF